MEFEIGAENERHKMIIDLKVMEAVKPWNRTKMSLFRDPKTEEWGSKYLLSDQHCKDIEKGLAEGKKDVPLFVKSKMTKKNRVGKKTKPPMEPFGSVNLGNLTINVKNQDFPLRKDD
jgi:hypothetical protein